MASGWLNKIWKRKMAFLLLFDWRMVRSGGADEKDKNARWSWG